MTKKIILTADGSSTIYVESLDECYHSVHGAIQESQHIFIQSGLHVEHIKEMQLISILEIGFGTGLNALLTYFSVHKTTQKVRYTGIEPYPISAEEIELLNYGDRLSFPYVEDVFKRFHSVEWEIPVFLSDHFVLTKRKISILDIALPFDVFDLVYFDAFSPDVQPELWSDAVFENIFNSMKPQGILLTYSTKGDVKRSLKRTGFHIEKLPGPVGKREILRAFKR
jgi:tRNA U34 5-methylaminomethyl-2-thiouridine-forming methyltransferase MnmC